MPLTSNAHSHSVSLALSAAVRSARNYVRSPWLFLAGVGVLLTIALQMLVMAQLAQHQVQRGVELRQGLAVEAADVANPARAAADLPTQSALQSSSDSLPGYVLR